MLTLQSPIAPDFQKWISDPQMPVARTHTMLFHEKHQRTARGVVFTRASSPCSPRIWRTGGGVGNFFLIELVGLSDEERDVWSWAPPEIVGLDATECQFVPQLRGELEVTSIGWMIIGQCMN